MRSIKLAAVLFPVSLVACGGTDTGNNTVTPTGAHTHYVINSVAAPTTNDEATQFGLDIGASKSDQPDGTVDNALGHVLAALKGQGFDVKSTLDAAVNEGKIILLADVQTTDFTNAAAAGLQVFLGANPSPSPCNGSADTTCGHQFMGGSFSIATDSPTDALVAGPFVNGTFNGGPGSIGLQLALGGTNPVNLSLQNARVKMTGVTGTAIGEAIIGGAVSQNDLNTQVIPAITAQLGPLITRDCPYASSTNNCACNQCQAAPGAGSADVTACTAHGDQTSCTADTAHGCVYDSSTTGKTILGLFDSNMDCQVTTAEVLGNTLIKSLLAPDVCVEATCAAPDALSIGIKATAVAGTFTVPGEGSN